MWSPQWAMETGFCIRYRPLTSHTQRSNGRLSKTVCRRASLSRSASSAFFSVVMSAMDTMILERSFSCPGIMEKWIATWSSLPSNVLLTASMAVSRLDSAMDAIMALNCGIPSGRKISPMRDRISSLSLAP